MKIYSTPQEVLNAMNEKFKDAGMEQFDIGEAVLIWGIDEPGITEEDVNAWVQHKINVDNGLL